MKVGIFFERLKHKRAFYTNGVTYDTTRELDLVNDMLLHPNKYELSQFSLAQIVQNSVEELLKEGINFQNINVLLTGGPASSAMAQILQNEVDQAITGSKVTVLCLPQVTCAIPSSKGFHFTSRFLGKVHCLDWWINFG